MQELCKSINRANLGIMGIKEGDVEDKSIGNIINKIIAGNSPSLLLSWFCYYYYCNLANTTLHIVPGQKLYLVGLWEDKKGMETILLPKIN
jgi:hypothetical protein